MKVILWGCLHKDYEEVLKKGETVFDAKVFPGGIYCKQLASGLPHYEKPQLQMPIIYIEKGNCLGIWITGETEEVEELAKNLLNLVDVVKKYQSGEYMLIEEIKEILPERAILPYKELKDKIVN